MQCRLRHSQATLHVASHRIFSYSRNNLRASTRFGRTRSTLACVIAKRVSSLTKAERQRHGVGANAVCAQLCCATSRTLGGMQCRLMHSQATLHVASHRIFSYSRNNLRASTRFGRTRSTLACVIAKRVSSLTKAERQRHGVGANAVCAQLCCATSRTLGGMQCRLMHSQATLHVASHRIFSYSRNNLRASTRLCVNMKKQPCGCFARLFVRWCRRSDSNRHG